MNDKTKKAWKIVGMTICWHVLTFFFGLLQVGIFIIIIFSKKMNLELYIKDLILNCNLIFFNIGLVLSIIIDQYIMKCIDKLSKIEIVSISLIPLLIVGATITAYIIATLIPESELDYQVIKDFQVITIIASIIYTFGMKAFGYWKGEKK